MDEKTRQQLVSIQTRLLDTALEIDQLLTPKLLESEEKREPLTPPALEDGV